jgi:hypothetical protein
MAILDPSAVLTIANLQNGIIGLSDIPPFPASARLRALQQRSWPSPSFSSNIATGKRSSAASSQGVGIQIWCKLKGRTALRLLSEKYA